MNSSLITLFWLALASFVGWFTSTLSGGGSSLVIMPIIGFLLESAAIAPVTTVGAVFGNVERAIAYRKEINWEVIRWELPGAIVGSGIGAFVLSQLELEWINIVVAIFLLVSAFNLIFKKKDNQVFEVKSWYFLPGGLVYAFLSAVIGSMGPLLVPLYLNYGLNKKELLGTQATNRAMIHIVKTIAYTIFGILNLQYLGYGILTGLLSFPGNWLGNMILDKISEETFRKIVVFFIGISGLLMLWQQSQWLFNFVGY